MYYLENRRKKKKSMMKKEKEAANYTKDNSSYKCKGCEEIVDDLDFNCELELCCYCLDMMKEEEKEKWNESRS